MFGTIILFLLKFIVLTTGLVAGYWLLISAYKQEGWKKIVGIIFCVILLIHTAIISIIIAFKWIDYLRTGRLIEGSPCPMQQMMPRQNEMPMQGPNFGGERHRPSRVK